MPTHIILSEYDQEMPQSLTTDQPKSLWVWPVNAAITHFRPTHIIVNEYDQEIQQSHATGQPTSL